MILLLVMTIQSLAAMISREEGNRFAWLWMVKDGERPYAYNNNEHPSKQPTHHETAEINHVSKCH